MLLWGAFYVVVFSSLEGGNRFVVESFQLMSLSVVFVKDSNKNSNFVS